MSHKSWHTSVAPKVQGTWNLHNALLSHAPSSCSVDFFIMTSSVAGSVGTATESNYTAANSFMDNFAKFRRYVNPRATFLGHSSSARALSPFTHSIPDPFSILLKRIH